MHLLVSSGDQMKMILLIIAFFNSVLANPQSDRFLVYDLKDGIKNATNPDLPAVTCKATNKDFQLVGSKLALLNSNLDERTIRFNGDVNIVFSDPKPNRVTYEVFKSGKKIQNGFVAKSSKPTAIDVVKKLASCIYTLSAAELFDQNPKHLAIKNICLYGWLRFDQVTHS